MNDQKIKDAIKIECDRQHVGVDRQEYLYDMYGVLKQDHEYRKFDHNLLTYLAYSIEPDNGGEYRTTPVTFDHVLGGLTPSLIPDVMLAWFEWFNTVRDCTRNDAAVESVIKEFLAIHPFSDGNGRTAWLLRVWMLDQWDDPQPLPDYFKDEVS